MYAELEAVLGSLGAAAAGLKARLDLIYGIRTDEWGRRFNGLHDTVLPLCGSARSIFQQLRGSTSKRSRNVGSSPTINGRPNGSITGVDMRHLLLLLPYLLFDLLHSEVSGFNQLHDTHHVSPAQKLIIVLHGCWCFWIGIGCTGNVL